MSATFQELDQAKADAFADRMLGTVNQAMLALMISIGHRTRLFDCLAEMPPARVEEIAEKAGLQPRYVREWLGAMVTGRIMEYDPQTRTYWLPPEHAAVLTRAAMPNNLASMMQWVAVLGAVESEVVDKFIHGGGVHYCCYSRFHDVMADESAQTVVAGLKDYILPLEPGLSEQLEAGIDVLDVGCGAGRAMAFLAEAFPKSRFTGYDFSEEAITMAKAEAERRGLTNLRFEVRDVAQLNEREQYDLITAFDIVHDQADPARVLREIHAALRPDGLFLMQDIDASSHLEKNREHPIGPMLYTISTMHCMTVSLAQNGAGLGTVWGTELAEQMLKEAGFPSVRIERLPHDIVNCYYLVRKQA